MSRPTQTIDRERLDELERSLQRHQRTQSTQDTRSSGEGQPLPAASGAAPPAEPAGEEDDEQTVFAMMGGAERNGRWEPAARVNAWALMGGIKLDFRDCDLLEGTTEVRAYTMWGGITVIVPPDVNVEANGFGLMGGFSHVSHHAAEEDAPTLRIRGMALMAGVDVKVRPAKAEKSKKRKRWGARER